MNESANENIELWTAELAKAERGESRFTMATILAKLATLAITGPVEDVFDFTITNPDN